MPTRAIPSANAAQTALTPEQAELIPFVNLYAPTVAGWITSDEELSALAPSLTPPLTPARVAAWRKKDGLAFLLAVKRPFVAIGYGEINKMQEPGSHWLGHLVIAPEYRQQGYGKRLVRLLLDYAFRVVGSHKVSLVAFPQNDAARRCYEQAGMVCMGEERHRFRIGGPFHTLLRYDMLPESFRQMQG